MNKIHIDAKDVEHKQEEEFTLGINIDCAYPPLPVTWCIIISKTDEDTVKTCNQSEFADYFDDDPKIQQTFSSCEDAYNTDIVKSLESTFTGKLAKKRDTKLSFEITVNDITLAIESNGRQVVGNLCAGMHLV